MAEDWLTTAEAAELSGYHPERIRELVRNGKVKGLKFATVWQIDRISLTEYLEAARDQDDQRWGPKSN